MTTIRLPDGRALAPRVRLVTGDGRHLCRLHAELALRLCTAGTARPVAVPSGPVRYVSLERTPAIGSRLGPPTFGIVQGAASVYRQHLGNLTEWAGLWAWAFRRLPHD